MKLYDQTRRHNQTKNLAQISLGSQCNGPSQCALLFHYTTPHGVHGIAGSVFDTCTYIYHIDGLAWPCMPWQCSSAEHQK